MHTTVSYMDWEVFFEEMALELEPKEWEGTSHARKWGAGGELSKTPRWWGSQGKWEQVFAKLSVMGLTLEVTHLHKTLGLPSGEAGIGGKEKSEDYSSSDEWQMKVASWKMVAEKLRRECIWDLLWFTDGRAEEEEKVRQWLQRAGAGWGIAMVSEKGQSVRGRYKLVVNRQWSLDREGWGRIRVGMGDKTGGKVKVSVKKFIYVSEVHFLNLWIGNNALNKVIKLLDT